MQGEIADPGWTTDTADQPVDQAPPDTDEDEGGAVPVDDVTELRTVGRSRRLARAA
jgi:hypothetical protein